MSQPTRVPPAAAWLGGLGLLPFVAGAVATVGDVVGGVDALRFYAATILAFMGGIHWGLAIADHGAGPGQGSTFARLGASVVPALIAWLALLLAPTQGLLVMALAFALLLVGDLIAVRRGLAPPWYPRLRIPLTGAVLLCLLTAALAQTTHESSASPSLARQRRGPPIATASEPPAPPAAIGAMAHLGPAGRPLLPPRERPPADHAGLLGQLSPGAPRHQVVGKSGSWAAGCRRPARTRRSCRGMPLLRLPWRLWTASAISR